MKEFTRITFSDTIDAEKESTLAVLSDDGELRLGFDLALFPDFFPVYPEGYDYAKDPYDADALIGRIALHHIGNKIIADPAGLVAVEGLTVKRFGVIVGVSYEDNGTVASHILGFSAEVQ